MLQLVVQAGVADQEREPVALAAQPSGGDVAVNAVATAVGQDRPGRPAAPSPMEPSIARQPPRDRGRYEPALILQPAYEQFHIGPKQSERIDLGLTAPPKERL